jgi:hypothetical protein
MRYHTPLCRVNVRNVTGQILDKPKSAVAALSEVDPRTPYASIPPNAVFCAQRR